MKCISTEDPLTTTDFVGSIFTSLPSVGGLWLPAKIEKMDSKFFHNLPEMTFLEISTRVLSHILGDDSSLLEEIIAEAYPFQPRIESINDNEHFLETFWGPTFTFKDFGAQFMAVYLQRTLENRYRDIPPEVQRPVYTVLVSTSGDTGSAIASAFEGKSFFKVVILYPNNRVSDIQELQLTTYGDNVTSLAIESDFDTCQRFVKNILKGDRVGEVISANSINTARLLPQCLYYFYAYSVLKKPGRGVSFVVPCGNCGNLTGGIIARELGLPIDYFIAAQNSNNTLEKFINTGYYKPQSTINTISNAMDVGDPSNVKRIVHMFRGREEEMRDIIKTVSVSDQDTKDSIKHVYDTFGYIIDPHTAVAYSGYRKLKVEDRDFVFVSTAHPAKFSTTIEGVIGRCSSVSKLDNLRLATRKKYIVNNNYEKCIGMLEKMGRRKGVVLIGMPGSGKTSVARELARVYGLEYKDIDESMELVYNCRLPSILLQYGEDGLKSIEEKTIMNTDLSTPVIATGGSVIYSEKGIRHLRNNIVLYLRTEFRVLAERTNNFTDRGVLFNGKSPIEMYKERNVMYESVCDVTIDCHNLRVLDIAQVVKNLLPT